MSCFIVSNQTTANLAETIAAVMNSRLSNTITTARRLYDYAEPELHEAFGGCVVRDYCEPEKVADLLRRVNVAAYYGRYNGNPSPVEIDNRSIPEGVNLIQAGRLCEFLKGLQCYLYQITEDPTYNGETYKAIRSLPVAVAFRISEEQDEYKASAWG